MHYSMIGCGPRPCGGGLGERGELGMGGQCYAADIPWNYILAISFWSIVQSSGCSVTYKAADSSCTCCRQMLQQFCVRAGYIWFQPVSWCQETW